MKHRIPKILILMSTGYAFVMLAHWPLGFTFFTQLSNLFAALVALGQLTPRWQNRLTVAKYAATVSICVTFAVYLTVLAPISPGGILAAYAEDHWASLCLHVITPVCCTLDFMLNDAPTRHWRRRDALWALLPPVAWLLLILALGQLGLRWHGMAAPYPFLNYAGPAGWFGWMPETAGIGAFYAVLALLALFLLVSHLLLRLARACRSKG